jgi:predicted house-cleaning noncanonical NTP pyrophosphatase (MazG superfamily)
MRITYNKLIRDKIPEIIRFSGKEFKVEVMSEDDYRKALLNKLVEEAQEAQKTEPNKLAVELSDLLEVVDAVIDEFDLSKMRLLWTDN